MLHVQPEMLSFLWLEAGALRAGVILPLLRIMTRRVPGWLDKGQPCGCRGWKADLGLKATKQHNVEATTSARPHVF